MFCSSTVCGVNVPSYALYIVCIIAIVVYGWCLRHTGRKDVLAKKYFEHPLCGEIDGWSITHVLFFFVLGVLYPGRPLQFFTAGVLWEIVETCLGQNHITTLSGTRVQLIGDQDQEGRATGKKDAYWYGKAGDIIVDQLGYLVGSALAGGRKK